jgi:hypothetical protein
MSTRIFTLVMNEIFVQAPNIVWKSGYDLNLGLVNNLIVIACFISLEKWGSQEKLPFKTQLPYEHTSHKNLNPYMFEAIHWK